MQTNKNWRERERESNIMTYMHLDLMSTFTAFNFQYLTTDTQYSVPYNGIYELKLSDNKPKGTQHNRKIRLKKYRVDICPI